MTHVDIVRGRHERCKGGAGEGEHVGVRQSRISHWRSTSSGGAMGDFCVLFVVPTDRPHFTRLKRYRRLGQDGPSLNLGIHRVGPGFKKPKPKISGPSLAWTENAKLRPEPRPNGLKREFPRRAGPPFKMEVCASPNSWPKLLPKLENPPRTTSSVQPGPGFSGQARAGSPGRAAHA